MIYQIPMAKAVGVFKQNGIEQNRPDVALGRARWRRSLASRSQAPGVHR